MVFRKIWEGLTQLSPEAQAELDREIRAIQDEGEEIQAQIEASRDAALAVNQQQHQATFSSEHQKAIDTATQEIIDSVEKAIDNIAKYPTNISNKDFEGFSRKGKLVSLISQITMDIRRVNLSLTAFNSFAFFATKSIVVWGEVPQDLLDNIEEKREALQLAQENKIRELESIKAQYEAELEELKSSEQY